LSCGRRAALLATALSVAPAKAQGAGAADDPVQIVCSELTTERAAELESRLRANLLTSEPAVRVLVTCQTAKTELRVASTTDEIAVDVQSSSVDTFRDDVLRAVEDARLLLARRRASATAAPIEAPPNQPLPAPAPASSPPVTVAVPPPPPLPAKVPAPLVIERSWTELFGQLLGESWGPPVAGGGRLGIARSTPVLWYGLRTAVLRSAAQSSDFSATEWHASAELGLQPAIAAGVRVAFGLGPSVLFVAPHGGLTARARTATSALFVEARVSRPFWFGHWAILPELGVRLFTRERGVRIDAEERLDLRGFVPQLSVGVAYRAD
jgi:hypothetical protein